MEYKVFINLTLWLKNKRPLLIWVRSPFCLVKYISPLYGTHKERAFSNLRKNFCAPFNSFHPLTAFPSSKKKKPENLSLNI